MTYIDCSKGSVKGVPLGFPATTILGHPFGSPLGIPLGISLGFLIGFPKGYPKGFPNGIPKGIPKMVPTGIPAGILFRNPILFHLVHAPPPHNRNGAMGPWSHGTMGLCDGWSVGPGITIVPWSPWPHGPNGPIAP